MLLIIHSILEMTVVKKEKKKNILKVVKKKKNPQTNVPIFFSSHFLNLPNAKLVWTPIRLTEFARLAVAAGCN